MDAYTLYLQTLYNGLVDQGKPVPVRLQELLNGEAAHLLLQHPTGTWRDDILTSIEFDSAVCSLAIRPACKETNWRDWLAVGLSDATVRVLDLGTGERLWLGLGHIDAVTTVCWSVEGLLASGGGQYRFDFGRRHIGSMGGEVLLWRPVVEAGVGTPLWRGKGHTEGVYDSGVYSVSWSSDGLLASGGSDSQVLVWRPDLEAREGEPLWRGVGHTSHVYSVSWSSEGLLATGVGEYASGVPTWKRGRECRYGEGRGW